jgi:hypothetical protein
VGQLLNRPRILSLVVWPKVFAELVRCLEGAGLDGP